MAIPNLTSSAVISGFSLANLSSIQHRISTNYKVNCAGLFGKDALGSAVAPAKYSPFRARDIASYSQLSIQINKAVTIGVGLVGASSNLGSSPFSSLAPNGVATVADSKLSWAVAPAKYSPFRAREAVPIFVLPLIQFWS